MHASTKLMAAFTASGEMSEGIHCVEFPSEIKHG